MTIACADPSSIRVQVLLTGNELMTGVTTDSNSAMIADKFAPIGLSIYRKVTVADEMEGLISEMEALSSGSDVLIVNGGLGPTIDDLTVEAVGRLIGQPIIEFQEAKDHLKEWCAQRNYVLNEANRKQSFLPKGAIVIPNPVGSAVGFSVEWNDCLLIFTPGVPSELRIMLDQEIVGALQKRFPSACAPDITRMHLFGWGESSLQQAISDTFPDWPEEVEVSFRAGAPTLELKLTTFDECHRAIKAQWKEKLLALLGDCVVGEGSTSIQQELVALLSRHNKTVTTVESCTGGLIASKITEISGSSAVFEAGFVTYSNAMKHTMVGVSNETLEQHGAVSEAVVREMTEGALKRSGADMGVAVSGVAGPSGGTARKPVGTVWVAWGDSDSISAQCFMIPRERKLFQLMVSAVAMDLIRRRLLGIDGVPAYFSTYKFDS